MIAQTESYYWYLFVVKRILRIFNLPCIRNSLKLRTEYIFIAQELQCRRQTLISMKIREKIFVVFTDAGTIGSYSIYVN